MIVKCDVKAIADSLGSEEAKAILTALKRGNFRDLFIKLKKLNTKKRERREKEKEGKKYIVNDRFSLDKILPKKKNLEASDIHPVTTGGSKIKVRILHNVVAMWNSIQTVCSAFEADDRYDVLIILGALAGNKEKQLMYEEDHKFIFWDKYNANDDRADILIIDNHSDVDTVIPNCREYTKMIFAVPLSLIRYTHTSWWDGAKRGFERFSPDYYLVDSLLYQEIKETSPLQDKVVEMGNPKFDGIYEKSKQKLYEGIWRKLKGKKTILWTTDHGVYNDKVTADITFDLYANTIFSWALLNKEVGLIVRLHPTFIREMLNGKYWSKNDLNTIIDYCNSTPNIIWDDTNSYDIAYSLADGILTDSRCGITISALPTLKPICLLYRSDMNVESFHEDLMKEIYYSAHELQEVIDFLEMIKAGQDTMLEKRKAASKKYIKNFDGKNGERIKNFIEKKFQEFSTF